MKMIRILSVFVLVLAISSLSMADTGSGHKCMKHVLALENKIFHKLHAAMANKEELKLSDEQVVQLRDLKMNVKKDMIKRKAEIDLIDVDIKSKLWEDVINKKETDKLIDQKYELKKAKAKALIDVYAELKTILSDKQKNKLKKIMKQSQKMKRGYH